MSDRGAAAEVQRIAAFSDGNSGGNPAGVWIGESFPTDAEMQRTAARIADVLRKVDGAESVKVEETAGLPFLEIKIDKSENRFNNIGIHFTAVLRF